MKNFRSVVIATVISAGAFGIYAITPAIAGDNDASSPKNEPQHDMQQDAMKKMDGMMGDKKNIIETATGPKHGAGLDGRHPPSRRPVSSTPLMALAHSRCLPRRTKPSTSCPRAPSMIC